MRTNQILLGLVAVTAACAANPPDDFSDLAGVDAKSDAFSRKMKVVGSIRYDEHRDIAYKNPPKYAALTFDGHGGDAVEVTIDSNDGSSIAWILDSAFHVIARSEDQDPGVNHFTVTLPAGSAVKHYLVLRDSTLQRATFAVDFRRSSPACHS